MMNMQEFLTRLTTDKVLGEKISKVSDPKAAYAIAREAGLNDSFETFAAEMKKANDAVSEMSSAEVDSVIGGSKGTELADELNSDLRKCMLSAAI